MFNTNHHRWRRRPLSSTERRNFIALFVAPFAVVLIPTQPWIGGILLGISAFVWLTWPTPDHMGNEGHDRDESG